MKENNPVKLARFLKEYDQDYVVNDAQRRAAGEDMRFSIVPGGQWEGFMEDEYKDRVKLQLDKIDQKVEVFMGEFADNRIEPRFSPDGGSTSEDDAALLQGIYRRDFRRGRGKQSIMGAVSEAVRCGIGAIKLSTVYEDNEDPDDERQRVVFEGILNAYNSVSFDSNSKEEDKSDASRVVIVYEYTADAFAEEFPGKSLASINADTENRLFDWQVNDTIFIAHRYEIKVKKTKVHTFIDPESEKISHIDQEDLELVEKDLVSRGWLKRKEKTVERKELFKSVFSGSEILEDERKISGKMLPVIPIYAYRNYVDGKEYYYGFVRKQKDAQRTINLEFSGAAEISSSGSRDIPVVDARSIKGYEAHWNGNIYDKQYLPAVPEVDPVTGATVPVMHGVVPAVSMSPTSAAILELASSHIKETSGGQQIDVTDVDLSGKAIRALIKKGSLNTRSVWANIEAAVTRIGEVYKSIAEDVYSMPRLIGILREDGTEASEQLMKTALDEFGEITEVNNIKKMKFEVYSSAGMAYESERDETIETLRSLIVESSQNQSAAEYQPALYASLFDNITGTGLDGIKEFNRKKMLSMGMAEPKDEKEQAYLKSIGERADPQQELVKAAAEQQKAEAEDLRMHAIERRSKAELNRASAVEKVENLKLKKIASLREAISGPA